MTTKKPHYTEKTKPDLEAVQSLAENIAQTMQIRINWQKLNLKIRGVLFFFFFEFWNMSPNMHKMYKRGQNSARTAYTRHSQGPESQQPAFDLTPSAMSPRAPIR